MEVPIISLWSVPHIIPPSCKLRLLSLILALVWLWAWRSCYLQSINEPLQVRVVLLSELSSVRAEFAVAWSWGYCCIGACFLLSTSNPRMNPPPPSGSFLPSSDSYACIIVSFAQFRQSPQIQFRESIASFHLFVFSSLFLHQPFFCCAWLFHSDFLLLNSVTPNQFIIYFYPPFVFVRVTSEATNRIRYFLFRGLKRWAMETIMDPSM